MAARVRKRNKKDKKRPDCSARKEKTGFEDIRALKNKPSRQQAKERGGPRLRLRPRLAHHNGPRHGGLECGAEVQQPLLVVLA